MPCNQTSKSTVKVFLITMFSVHVSYIYLLTLHLPAASPTSNEIMPSFQDIDFTNITLLDILARKAMKHLHDDLDHDDDGNVSLSEGAEFIDREDFELQSSNLPGFATDKDGRITEAEFWESWITSAVHNWTVSEMVEWLSVEVDLPQYADKFRRYGISGAAMPIFLDPDFKTLKKVGIPSNPHKRKIHFRAMEIVIFGPPKPKSNLLKDILLTISITMALSGLAYAVHVRRSAGKAIADMQEKLNNLQSAMNQLDEDDAWTKSSINDDLAQGSLEKREFSSSQSSLSSEVHLQSRLSEVMDELSDAKMMLEQAEERLNDQKWLPPSRLIYCLKMTYKVEAKLHEAKRHQAQKKVEQAKSQFMKMKKKASIFTSVQLVHSHQVDNFDLEVQTAKDFLSEVQHEAREFKKRWLELELICNCRFISSSITRSNAVSRRSSASTNDVSGTIRSKNSFSQTSNGVKSKHVEGTLYDEGLEMKEISSNKSADKNSKTGYVHSQHSCPSHLSSHGTTGIRQRSLTLQRVPETERFSERFQTLPRKKHSPLLVRQNKSAPVTVTPNTEQKADSEETKSHRRQQSLQPFEGSQLTRKKSLSSHSLPDLLADEKKANKDSKDTASLTSENGKPSKKRNFFGSRIRKIIKT